jgi:hypothetical protein
VDPADALDFSLFMLPFAVCALAVVWIGYEAWRVREARAHAPPPAPLRGPDPIRELERLHTETARLLAQSRLTLEATRDTLQRGIRG